MKKKLTPFAALLYRDFRLMLLAVFLSQVGAQIQLVTVTWHMYTLTHSALFLGYLGLAGFLPIPFFSLLGGTLVDRFNRKILFMISLLIVSVSAGVLAVTSLQHAITPEIIYIAVALSACAATISIPARQSMMPSLIPKSHFLNGISMSSMVWQAAVVVGPMLGGLLIAWYGVQSAYITNMVLSIGTVSILLFLNLPDSQEKSPITVTFSSVKEGIQFVMHTPMIYATMLLDFFATFFASASVLMPIFAKDILSVGPQGVGLLYSAPAIGSLVSGLFLALLPVPKKQGLLLLIGVSIYGLATVCFGISQVFILSLVMLALAGAGDMISAVIRNTVRQLETPDELRGRMVAINMNFFVGGPYLGDMEAGITAHWWGAPTSVVIGGIATILFTMVVTLAVPTLRKYTAEELQV